jgi:Ca2+-binding EF-hand superfamily protein
MANYPVSLFQEAMTKIGCSKSKISEEEIAEAFHSIDMDHDGYVSLKEAKRAYKKLSKNFDKPTDQVCMQLCNGGK